MPAWGEFTGLNRGYVLELYEKFRQDPSSVDEATRAAFEQWTPPPQEVADPTPVSGDSLHKAVGAINLAQSIRRYGHLAATIDPLGCAAARRSVAAPRNARRHRRRLCARLPASPDQLAALPAVRRRCSTSSSGCARVYCSTTGYDFAHIFVPEERRWLREAPRSAAGSARRPIRSIRCALLDRLTQVEAFEKFLHRIVPRQDAVLDRRPRHARADPGRGHRRGGRGGHAPGVRSAMAHRGRLNVMAHVLGKPYEQILAEFKDPGRRRSSSARAWSGAATSSTTPARIAHDRGRRRSGPGRLDAAEPEPPRGDRSGARGHGARGRHDCERAGRAACSIPTRALPILIHGDAAFPGQGVVAETLNLHRLPGYTTGGTIHIIANNQIGFTTEPEDAYSTLYASGLARGFKIPIVHVNADDPEACVAAARLAFAYRVKFKRDFLIDLVGYRRYGHNEGDEPAFTQPLMYQKITAHPTVREQLGDRRWNRARRRRTPERAEAMLTSRTRRAAGDARRASSRSSDFVEPTARGRRRRAPRPRPRPRCRSSGCASSTTRCSTLPSDFHVHRKLERGREKRAQRALPSPTGATIDWAAAEELAMATILADGTPIRLTGEDVERGTFSHRHAVLYDVDDRRRARAAADAPAGARGVRDPQQPAHRERRHRLRVRLQHPGAGTAGDLGSAVRRLHQRRPDDARRVRAVGARRSGARSRRS